jgi:hypothetical protein
VSSNLKPSRSSLLAAICPPRFSAQAVSCELVSYTSSDTDAQQNIDAFRRSTPIDASSSATARPVLASSAEIEAGGRGDVLLHRRQA